MNRAEFERLTASLDGDVSGAAMGARGGQHKVSSNAADAPGRDAELAALYARVPSQPCK